MEDIIIENESITKEVTDLLNRGEMIEQLKQILLLLSEGQKGCVFALDGGWGYGKTYILERLGPLSRFSTN